MYLEEKLKQSRQGCKILAEIKAKAKRFIDSGLADPHFKTEFFNGGKYTFFQRLWEINLAHYLWDQGLDPTSTAKGPDFKIVLDGRTIWIEAVSPIPEGLPDEYLQYPQYPRRGEIQVLHYSEDVKKQVLLRITGAISAKHKQFEEAAQRGQVDPSDICIVAVDCAQLGLVGYRGIADILPSVFCATYPVGPIKVPFGKDPGQDGEPFYSHRPSILKHTGSSVPTNVFVDGSVALLSAVIGARSCVQGVDKLSIVHNLTAEVPLPAKILKAEQEFVFYDMGDDIQFEDVLKD